MSKYFVRGGALQGLRWLAAIETDEHVLWPGSIKFGYGVVEVARSESGDRRTRHAHSLALEMRLGPCPPGADGALHGPGCPKHCINYRHLRWGTHAENMADRGRDGTRARGGVFGYSKLVAAQVTALRSDRAAGLIYADLAAKYNISITQVGRIVRGDAWEWMNHPADRPCTIQQLRIPGGN